MKALLFLLCVSSSGLVAGELYGVKFNDSIKVEEKTLTLNGMGLRSVTRFGLKIKVYVIGLYLPEKMSDAEKIVKSEGPKVYKMVFKRNVDSEKIEDGWKEAYKKNCKPHCEKNEGKLKEFNDTMSDMRTNKAITVTVYKDKLHVDAQGRKPRSATIQGEDFARIVEKIWLGNPPNGELKTGLLGKSK